FFHRCHCDVINAAWNNVIKRRKIAAYTQLKAVHDYPIAHSYPNRTNLAIVDPNSRERCASCRINLILSQHFDEQLLEPPQISVQILTTPTQVDNRITHQLSGPVIRRLTSAIDRDKWMGPMRCAQQARLIGSPPDCVNRFMLEQKQFVRI